MTKQRSRLVAGVAAAIIVAALGGFGLAKFTTKPSAPAAAESAEKAAASDNLVMAPAAVTSAGIEVQTVTAGGLSSEILAQATVTPAPNGQAILTAPAAGAVTRILKRLGDPVRAGETIAIVESRDAAQFAADRDAADAKAALAHKRLTRETSLYQQRVSPRMDLETAEAEAAAADAEARRARVAAGAARVTADGRGVVVSSPISGRITSATVSLGAFVQPDTELFRVANPQLIQVEASVGAADALRIAPGDRAVLELPDGRILEGQVRAVTPALDATSRTATAVLDVGPGGLQPGQTARVRIYPRVAVASTSIVVPDEAVQTVGGKTVVFVRTQTGFRVQPVTTGERSAGRVEIVSGLQPGAQIATRNAFLLKAELGKGEGEDE